MSFGSVRSVSTTISLVVVAVIIIAAAGSLAAYTSMNNSNPSRNNNTSIKSSSVSSSIRITSSSSTSQSRNRSLTTIGSLTTKSYPSTTSSMVANTWEEEYKSSIVTQSSSSGTMMSDSSGYLIFTVFSNNSISGSGRGTGTINETGPCTGSGKTTITFSAIGEYVPYYNNVTVAFDNINPLSFQWTVSCEGGVAQTEQAGNPFPYPAGFAVRLANDQSFTGTYNGNGEMINYTWTLYSCPNGLCPLPVN